jgi:serine/threonine protein kinase
MTIGKFPFEAPNLYALFEVIATGNYTIPEGTDANLADLIRAMLQVDYHKRISIEEIRKHPFMLDVLKEEPFIPIIPLPTMFTKSNKPNNSKKKKALCACSTM